MADDSNYQMARSAVGRWYIFVGVFSVVVVLWLSSHNWVLGLGAFSTFFSILLFAGQLLSKRTSEQASFSSWSKADKIIFCFSLVSTVGTGAAYALALPTMFGC